MVFNAFGEVRKHTDHVDAQGLRSVFLEYATSDEAAAAGQFNGFPIKGTAVNVTKAVYSTAVGGETDRFGGRHTPIFESTRSEVSASVFAIQSEALFQLSP